MFPYHILLTDEEKQKEIREGCTHASLGCVECKKIFMQGLERFLAPIHERRAGITKDYIEDILAAGNENARKNAEETMRIVRHNMRLI